MYQSGGRRVRAGSYLEDGVVLPRVLGVVALQQAAAHGGAGTRELRHVEVREAELRGEEQAMV